MTVELNAVFSTEYNLEDIFFFFQEVLILEESEFLPSAIS